MEFAGGSAHPGISRFAWFRVSTGTCAFASSGGCVHYSEQRGRPMSVDANWDVQVEQRIALPERVKREHSLPLVVGEFHRLGGDGQ